MKPSTGVGSCRRRARDRSGAAVAGELPAALRTPGAGQSPFLANEGHDEAMEFANGNSALLKSALDYQNDTTAPTITPIGPDVSATPFDVKFSQSEAADIHYTTDGSTPTMSSPAYQPAHSRGLPAPIHIGGTTTLRWIAADFKGNTSTGSRTFYMPQPLQASATSANGAGDPPAAIGGLASPTTLLTWTGPAVDDVALTFTQAIGATDALRTGSYGKTLTFTLSTTTP